LLQGKLTILEHVVQELHQRHTNDQQTLERNQGSIQKLELLVQEAERSAKQEKQDMEQLREKLAIQQGMVNQEEALDKIQQEVDAAEERVAKLQQEYDIQLKEVQSQVEEKDRDIAKWTDRHVFSLAQEVTQKKDMERLQEELKNEVQEKKQLLQEQQQLQTLSDEQQEQWQQQVETDKKAFQMKLETQNQLMQTLKTELQEAKTTPIPDDDDFQERMEIATASVDAANQREQTAVKESKSSLKKLKQAQMQLKVQYMTLQKLTQEQADSKVEIQTLQQELKAALARAEIAELPRPGWIKRIRTRLFGRNNKKR
jgi:hypothetical protein